MLCESTRFGSFEIPDEDVLVFADELAGLPGTRYALIGKAEQLPFVWLHSTERAELAVPVTDPWLFVPDYDVRVPDEDVQRLGLTSPEDAEIYCVVRAVGEVEDHSINLAAPIVIHAARRLGRQIINAAGRYPVRHPLFSEVELNEVQRATSSTMLQATAV